MPVLIFCINIYLYITTYYSIMPQIKKNSKKSYPIGMTSGGSVVGGFIKVYWRDVV